MTAKQKVRQPLPLVEIVLSESVESVEWLEEHAALIREELNVKNVEFTRTGGGIHQLQGAPRFEAAWTAAGDGVCPCCGNCSPRPTPARS